MRKTGSGNIIVIGATASKRGGAHCIAFASAKAAQRSLAQSVYFLATQPQQAWLFELDLRPYTEHW